MQELLMMGVGTTSFVAERLREVGDQWVREGKIDPDQARMMMDEVVDKLKTDQGQFEERMQRQMRHVLQDLGVPRQSELDELRGRIDRLERQLRNLEDKQWR
ncbi:phasin family protein [Spirulina sp. CS-785/01]|nr:phasin family protein [Spirulina sp. CS-785/01]MDB9313372.1 phasin family protein [Spirulina sp. CS-785/01]